MIPAVGILFVILITAKTQASTLDDDLRPLCQCGSNSSLETRVVGGHKAGLGTFPYAIGLTSQPNSEDIRAASFYCGATLISDSFLVTAAHCVKYKLPEDLVISVGNYDFREPVNAEVKRAKSILKFPEYTPGVFHYDIALIELEEPISWETGIRAAILPPPDLLLEPDTIVAVFGWGRLGYRGKHPNTLRSVDLPVVENSICQEKFHTEIMTNMLCAGGIEGHDACVGDSGSGLVVRLGNEYVLCGIVSFGRNCALPDIAGVYTKVASYTDWILNETLSSQCRPCVYDGEYPHSKETEEIIENVL